jgi:TM2 domain-containing membrane protein YozV
MYNRQATIAGVFLIAVGLLWWLNLWWLLLPAALMVAGVAGYLQRHAVGRDNEALQAGLWGIGLGLLFLVGFVWPGILFLAGASVLLRGREDQARAALEQVVVQVRGRVRPQRRAEQVPVESVPTFAVPVQTSEATRFHE